MLVNAYCKFEFIANHYPEAKNVLVAIERSDILGSLFQ